MRNLNSAAVLWFVCVTAMWLFYTFQFAQHYWNSAKVGYFPGSLDRPNFFSNNILMEHLFFSLYRYSFSFGSTNKN